MPYSKEEIGDKNTLFTSIEYISFSFTLFATDGIDFMPQLIFSFASSDVKLPCVRKWTSSFDLIVGFFMHGGKVCIIDDNFFTFMCTHSY